MTSNTTPRTRTRTNPSNLTDAEKREIAETIRAQLGGFQFALLTGAKLVWNGESDLSFSIGANPNRITHVKVEYDRGLDAYNMYFYRLRKLDLQVVTEYHGVGAEQLQDLFESATGLFVTVRKRG